MSRFRTGAAVAAVAGVVALPSTAAPPERGQVRTISVAAGPVAAVLAGKRYSLRLSVTQALPTRATTLTLSFTRSVGSSSQTHDYSFPLSRRAFSCRGRSLRCVLETGRSLRRFGDVRLSVAATGRRRRGMLDAGCSGRATRTPAVAQASIQFRDPSVSLAARYGRRLGASIRGVRATCAGATPCHTHLLGLGGDDAAGAFALVAPTTARAQAQLAFALPENTTAPAAIQRSVTVRNLRPGSFAISPDLSSANFSIEGSPFLSGSVTYTARGAIRKFASKCGVAEVTLGGTTGDVAAFFDGAARRPLLATGGYLEKIP